MEADLGSGPVWRMGTKLPEGAEPFRVALLNALKPFGVIEGPRDEQGGSDVKPLGALGVPLLAPRQDATRYFDIRSEEHTSELQSLMRISYAVFCLKNKTILKT